MNRETFVPPRAEGCLISCPGGIVRTPVAKGLFRMLAGLICRRLSPGPGLLIPGCRQVHTFFMRYPIDAVFIASDGRVLGVEAGLRPWRVSRWYAGSACVLELAAGDAAGLELKPGIRLRLESNT